jgi:hypothetical protein
MSALTIAYVVSASHHPGHLGHLVHRLDTGLRTIAECPEATPGDVRFFRQVEWSRAPAHTILTRENYPHLVESSCLLARRFDTAVDDEIVDRVDRHLLADRATAG